MLKLLIADDEVTIRNGLKDLIESFELDISKIYLAEDGEEAVNLIKKELPEIILMDINMPKLNGLKAIEKIKDLNPHAKIIIISGYNDFSYAQKAIDLGVYKYLLKPVNYKHFKDIIEESIEAYYKENMPEKSNKEISLTPVEYMQKNFANENLSVSYLANELFVSKSYIIKYVKENTGHNFTDYLNMLRLKKARILMADESLSLKEISIMVGYKSQHYFSRAFKNYYDESPSDYRKINK